MKSVSVLPFAMLIFLFAGAALSFSSVAWQQKPSRRLPALSSSPNDSSETRTYVGSLDQGTSSTRFILLDKNGDIVASSQREHKQHYPQPGWVEHDANEIWENSYKCMEDAMASFNNDNNIHVAAIGITNQRETTVVWDKDTGEPLCRAVVWNCARTSKLVSKYAKQLGGRDALLTKTGLPLSTYFSATKLRWMLDNVEGLAELVKDGKCMFGTIDCWLSYKLTGGQRHVTDVTNAARTLLCDLQTLDWDKDLLDIFDIPPTMLLPKIEPSIGGDFGSICATACPSLKDVPIGAILGDQHAATFGQACFHVGEAKATFGTGAFLMMNTGSTKEGERPQVSTRGLLRTPFYQIKGEPPVYALEGAVAMAGSLIQWLRDNLQIGTDAKEIAKLAASVENAGGVRFVPAFAGLFAPHWREDARGIIAGLTAYHTRAHIARAAIEAAAFQSAEVFDAMAEDSGVAMSELRVDGGMTVNCEFLQFLANLLGTSVLRPQCLETTAVGVAYAAGLSVGVWKSLDDIVALWEADRSFQSDISQEERLELKRTWDKAIERSMGWIDAPAEEAAS